MTTIKEVFESLVQHELTIEKDIPTLQPNYDNSKVSVVSLFCGAGGIDLGVEIAGLEVALQQPVELQDGAFINKHRNSSIAKTVYALDFCKEAVDTFKTHFKESTVQHANIRHLQSFPQADLLLFGFPCPGFSASGPRDFKDERNYLYVHCCRALKESQPAVFIAENVPGMLTLQGGAIFKQILSDFKDCGYKVVWKILNSRNYGCCQLRERVIMVGVRNDIDYSYQFPQETHGIGKQVYLTLRECIGDLESDPGVYYQGSYSSQYLSRNRKKDWHEQSFTIQASARQAPLHPSSTMNRVSSTKYELVGEHRRLSVREAARIQSFPDWFSFSVGNTDCSHNTLVDKQFRQIGNAVPPLMMKHIVKPILEYLKGTI
ncbi:MAG: DNA cytosine methyltransferase [Kurthia sp.]|nr:DNA cytosine methyltransferase [Candidatus Kurthia equi]